MSLFGWCLVGDHGRCNRSFQWGSDEVVCTCSCHPKPPPREEHA